MENVRLLLIASLLFLGLLIYQSWQKDYGSRTELNDNSQTPASEKERVFAAGGNTEKQIDVPRIDSFSSASAVPAPGGKDLEKRVLETSQQGKVITVSTDLFSATVNLQGGSLERVILKKYPVDPKDPTETVELLGSSPTKVYLYQGGLQGPIGFPSHYDHYETESYSYELLPSANELTVPMFWSGGDGVKVTKNLVFRRDDYRIDVTYRVQNSGPDLLRVHHYEQLKRNEVSSRQGMIYTFSGAALSTPDKRFEKFDIDDLREDPIDVIASDSWVGVLQHYFVSALMAPVGIAYNYYSMVLPNNIFIVGFQSPANLIEPGKELTFGSSLYVGPKANARLEQQTEGMELAVDYGVLWFIAKPLFLMLTFFYEIGENWGWAIIALTILIKLIFYPLSAAGYRSMANMRKVQPRMLALRDRYKDDKAQLNQAMMKLYKDEKINPLGGCFPILVQIPVFIALYWVLLESVEIRQAPFILWITDLSSRDPYFVLPLLMGISMWGQQKLNPAPMDPIQAKVMQILPFVFTVFFAFFPSGLVLYWLVNNILSIAQQWRITHLIEKNNK